MPEYIAIFKDPRLGLTVVIVAVLFALGLGWRLIVTLFLLYFTAVIIIMFSFDISADALFQGKRPPEVDTDKWVAAHSFLFVWKLVLIAFAIARLKIRRSASPR